MIDDIGGSITDQEAIARVSSTGAVVVHCSHVEGEDLTSWRRRLRGLARERGQRLSVRKVEDLTYVLHNPDHVVTAEQLRATGAAIPGPPEFATSTPLPPKVRGSRRRLRVVKDE